MEFRDDVVRVARNREPGQKLAVIAKDFGFSASCLTNWMRQADVEDGARPGKTREESSELRDLRRRNRLLEQENEVLRRAAAYLSQANLPGKGPASRRTRTRCLSSSKKSMKSPRSSETPSRSFSAR
ncbi:transposase [Dermacoccus abyssi]|uniref:transposase n=1 Tax=Dermacoccus abyssi TaxID=322596 RepID=UPI0038994C3F